MNFWMALGYTLAYFMFIATILFWVWAGIMVVYIIVRWVVRLIKSLYSHEKIPDIFDFDT